MTFPFWSLVAEHREAGLVVGVLVGFGFGFVLERAGFGRAPKLAAQFYGTDMTVFKVMFGSIVTAMLGLVLLSGLGLVDFKAVADNATSLTFLWPMIVGGLALGAGFIVSGYCPGTSLVAAASGKSDGWMTVIGVIAGQVIWTGIEHLPGVAKLQNASDLGHLYLWELLHLPARAGQAIVALAITAVAVACFFGAEKLERLLARPAAAAPAPGGRPRRLVFAGFAAAAAAGLAAVALPTGGAATPAPAARLQPMELARRVLDEPWKVRVVDVRPMAECAARRVPGAECVPAAELSKLGLADANGARELVLVGAGDLAEAPAAAAAYPGRVALLAGGFPAWEAFALKAPEPPAAGAAPSEIEGYRLRAGIAAAMTGVKAAPPPPTPSGEAGPKKKAGGGGCGG